MDFLPILAQTIPVFLVMGVGFACQRMGLINDDLEKGIMRLVLNVLLPCFILWKVPGNPALQSSGVVVSALGWGMGITAISFAICFGAGKLIGLSKETGVATFAVAVGLQNYGFIPISLIEGIFMKDTALPMLGVLFVRRVEESDQRSGDRDPVGPNPELLWRTRAHSLGCQRRHRETGRLLDPHQPDAGRGIAGRSRCPRGSGVGLEDHVVQLPVAIRIAPTPVCGRRAVGRT